jgi:hypothetical protein
LRLGEILDSPLKFVTPLVYTAILLPTAFLVLQMTLSIYLAWLPGVLFYLMPILLLSTVSGLTSWGLLRLERLDRPRIFDHLRRCSLLYAASVFLAFLLVSAAYKGTTDVGSAVVVVALFCVFNAIFADALVLLLKHWRFGRANIRSLS